MNDGQENEKSIFDDRYALLEIWKSRRQTIDADVNLVWKSANLFIMVLSAIISIDVIGIGLAIGQADSTSRILIFLPFLVLSAVVVTLSWIAKNVLKRRFSIVLQKFVHTTKIEGLLGLRVDISSRLQELGIFTSDQYLFQGFDSTGRNHRSEEEWIETVLKTENNTYTDARYLFLVTGIVGVTLSIINVGLIMFFIANS